MLLAIHHQLTVELGDGVPRAVQHLLLTPFTSQLQTVKEWRIEAPGLDGTGFVDAYGNRAHICSQARPGEEISITAAGVVATHDLGGVVGRLDRDPVPALFRRVTALTKPIGAITSRFRSAPKDGDDRIALLHALMERTGEVVRDAEPVQTQLQGGGGQSQAQSEVAAAPEAADFAHAFIGAARALDIPARFVTGYLLAGDEHPGGYHDWAEAWDDALGWIAFDAVLNECPTARHVRLATGLDAQSAAPLRSVPDAKVSATAIVEVADDDVA